MRARFYIPSATLSWMSYALCVVLRLRAHYAGRDRAVVSVDSNWVARKLNSKSKGPLPNINELVVAFLSRGVDVRLTYDAEGEHARHHSKKATIARQKTREQARIDLIDITMVEPCRFTRQRLKRIA